MPLTPAQCPLLAPSSPLAELFTRVEGLVATARKTLASALDSTQVERAEGKLAEVSELLQRDRYRVGFLGPSQLGKSSTLNRVVRKKLAGAGAGGPATSTVTRFLPCRPGTPARFTLDYMTSVQFQRRRVALVRCLRLPDCPPLDPDPRKTVRELQTENAQLLGLVEAEIARGKAVLQGGADQDTGAQPDSRGDDRTTLARLLRAFQSYGDQYILLGDRSYPESHPLIDDGDYSKQLFQYTNHRPEQAGHPNDLLWQIRVEFPTSDAAPTIELIDLPGLGTTREADDLTTLAFMDQLDGALVFLRASQSKEGTVGKILNALHGEKDSRWEFGREREPLRGRIWMVATRVDDLSPENLGLAGNNEETFLDHLAKTLDGFGIVHQHALLVANIYHDIVSRYQDGQVPKEVYELKLQLQTDPAGKPLLPPKFDRQPVLKEAYEQVVRDGGVEALRQTIGTDLADEVRTLVSRHVCRLLKDAANSMRQQVETLRQSGAFGVKEFVAARSWADAAHVLAGDRDVDNPRDPRFRELEAEAVRFFTQMKRELRKEFANISKNRLGNLRQQHEGDAYHLYRRGVELARKAVADLFEWAVKRLGSSGTMIDPIPLDDQPNPAQALKDRLDREAEQTDWYMSVLRSLEETVFFPSELQGSGGRPLSFGDYQEIIRRKLDAVVHEISHRAVYRAKTQLKEIRDRMAFLATKENQAKLAVDPAVLAKIVTDLVDVVERLRAEAAALSLPKA